MTSYQLPNSKRPRHQIEIASKSTNSKQERPKSKKSYSSCGTVAVLIFKVIQGR